MHTAEKFKLTADDRAPMSVTVDGMPSLREAMFAYQEHTGAERIIARNNDGAEIARLTFRWSE